MKISIIAAKSENDVIGLKNRLPWKIKEDIEYFKKKTKNHYVIVGRVTFEAMPENMLESFIIVVSKNKDYKAKNAIVVHSIKEGIDIARENGEKELFIAGGEKIYKQTLKKAHKMYLTEIKGNYNGDRLFPSFGKEWKEIKREKREGFDFVVYEKV